MRTGDIDREQAGGAAEAWRGPEAGARRQRGFSIRAMPPALKAVALACLALSTTMAVGAVQWWHGDESIVRFLHWWLVSVQGDDSWMPMRAAYAWHAAGHSGTMYRHVLFDQHIKFQYPPASLLIFVIPAALHLTVSNGLLNLIGWFSVLAEAAATAVLTALWTREWQQPRARMAAVILAFAMTLIFYPVLWGYTDGQIQAWLSAWFMFAALSFFVGRKGFAGALVGATCIAKPQFILFLVWALLRRERSFAAGMAMVLAVTFAASLYVFGWNDHVGYLSALSYISQHGETFIRNYSVNGLMNRLLHNGDSLLFTLHSYAPYNPIVFGATILNSIAFIAFCLLYRLQDETRLADLLIAGLCLTVASPVAWEHHYGFLPAAFALLAITLVRRSGAPWNGTFAAVLFAAFLACDIVMPPVAAWAGGPASILESTLLFGALGVLFLLCRLRADTPVGPRAGASGLTLILLGALWPRLESAASRATEKTP